MSMSIEEYSLGVCPQCGERSLDPFSGVCRECGYDHDDPLTWDDPDNDPEAGDAA